MIETLALILLIFRVLALCLLRKVLRAQWALSKLPVSQDVTALVSEEDIVTYRRQLFYLTLALAGSNLLPIIFDVMIMLKGTSFVFFTVSTTQLLIMYTISNAISALLSAFLVKKIYENALEVDKSHQNSDHTLMNDENHLKEEV